MPKDTAPTAPAGSGSTEIDVCVRCLQSSGDDLPAGHKSIRLADDRIEMVPKEGRNTIVSLKDGTLSTATSDAMSTGAEVCVKTTVDLAVMEQRLAYYQATSGQKPYWIANNSNFFVDWVVTGAGGNPGIPGVFAPAFAISPGPVRAVPPWFSATQNE